MGRQKNPEASVKVIISATLQLINEKSCTNFTFQDLVQLSGLSKGGIFHYVRNKNELFTLVLEDLLKNYETQFLDSLQSNPKDLDEYLKLFQINIGTYNNPDSAVNKILKYLFSQDQESQVSDLLKNILDKATKAIKTWIELGKSLGFVDKRINNQAIAEFCVLMNLGFRFRGDLFFESPRFTQEEFNKILIKILKDDSNEKK